MIKIIHHFLSIHFLAIKYISEIFICLFTLIILAIPTINLLNNCFFIQHFNRVKINHHSMIFIVNTTNLLEQLLEKQLRVTLRKNSTYLRI